MLKGLRNSENNTKTVGVFNSDEGTAFYNKETSNLDRKVILS